MDTMYGYCTILRHHPLSGGGSDALEPLCKEIGGFVASMVPKLPPV